MNSRKTIIVVPIIAAVATFVTTFSFFAGTTAAEGVNKPSSEKEPAGKIKNVLLIMSDDLKASVLPAYGRQRKERNGRGDVQPARRHRGR